MKNQSGFTIAELILVVVLAAILAAMAAPNMSEFVKNNARATNVNTMVTALNVARSEAVTRNTRVSVCKSADLASCDAAVGNGDFRAGWIVFTDAGVVGTVDAPPTDAVLRVFQPNMPDSASLRARRGGFPGVAIGGITYRRDGRPEDLAAPGIILPANTFFNYCDDRGAPDARAIAVSVSGHVSLSRDTDNDNTDEIFGTPLVCP